MSAPSVILPLHVSWSMSAPPQPAVDFSPWDNIGEPKISALDIAMEWPQGTLSVLHEAFRRRLTRKIGWQIPPAQDPAPFLAAARVFRRGVAIEEQAPQQSSGSYAIQFHSDMNWLELLPDEQLCFIDQRVATAFHIPPKPNRVFIQLDELSKTLDTVAQLRSMARKLGPGREWTIVGGGILADTAAFAAGLENCSFRLVPTTLLAMIDACIGGKTGVNFPPFGKNQVGLFAFPSEVFITTEFLRTLPPREFLAGMSEGWKHAVLKGDRALAAAVATLDQQPQLLPQYLRDLVAVKAEVVAIDPTEQGLRASLNLGHTLAHSIERMSQQSCPEQPILHGEAVGIGLFFCIELSHALGYLERESYCTMRKQLLGSKLLITIKKLQEFLARADLTAPELVEELLVGIKQDKKNSDVHASDWVLIEDWGQPVSQGKKYTVRVEDTAFRSAYLQFIATWQNDDATRT